MKNSCYSIGDPGSDRIALNKGGVAYHRVARSRLREWFSALTCPAKRDAATRQKDMYVTYILKSDKTGRHYIGHTQDINERLTRHNAGLVKSTKWGRPWSILIVENYNTKSEAYKREMEIKGYKGGIKFKKLIGLWKD